MATVIFFFPSLFIQFFTFHFCFLTVSEENSKSHAERTFLVNSSDILVICYESAYCISITFVLRFILIGLPNVRSDTGILKFKPEDK